MDHYTRKLKGDSEISHVIQHSTKTLYMNVIVKNSLKVVNNELERLAKIKWADDQSTKSGETDIERQRFDVCGDATYMPEDILVGHRFQDQIDYDPEKRTLVIDYSKMNETVPHPVWYPTVKDAVPLEPALNKAREEV